MGINKEFIKRKSKHTQRMGAYLDKPIEEKNPTHGKTN